MKLPLGTFEYLKVAISVDCLLVTINDLGSYPEAYRFLEVCFRSSLGDKPPRYLICPSTV